MRYQATILFTIYFFLDVIAASLAPAYAAGTPSTKSLPSGSHSSASNGTQVSPAPEKAPTHTAAKKNKKNNLAHLGKITVIAPIQKSLSQALETKRSSANIVDSVVAEDIGKLPDNNLADALERITGVQTARGPGETTSVIIRGLPNSITTLNGRRLFTSSGRGFAFQDLPAQAIKAANVYKTSSANLVAGGIAGLVNIQLRRPFDFKGPVVAVTAKGIGSENTGAIDPSTSLLLSDRWNSDAGEFGALINAAYHPQHFDLPLGFNDVESVYGFGDGKIFGPNAVGAIHQQGYRKRGEANYALQWQPFDNLSIYNEGIFDFYRANHRSNFFFSTLTTAQSLTDPKLFSPSTQYGCLNINGGRPCGLNSGTFHNPYTASSTQALTGRTNTWQDAIGGKWQHGALTLSTDASFTSSKNHTTNFIIDQYLNNVTTTINTIKGGHTNFSFAGNPQLNPDNYYLNGLFQNYFYGQGSEWAWRGEGEYDFNNGPISKLQFGLRYSDHNASESGALARNTPPPPDTLASSISPDYLHESPDNLPFVPRWFSGDPSYMRHHEMQIRQIYGAPAGSPPTDPTRVFNVDEKKYTGYLQGGYDFSLGNIPIDGLFGVRVVNTHRTLSGFTTQNGQPTPIATTTVRTKPLPNASARLHLTNDLQLRLSYARTLSYPAFSQLSPATNLVPPTVNRLGYGSGGNPDLTPIKSDNYDASLAWYFAPSSDFSIAGFYRSINGYIQTYTATETHRGVQYNVTRPHSAGSGYLDGAEVSYQQFFKFLPGPLDGLGAQVNYTYIDGQTKSPQSVGGPVTNTRLAQVSKNTYNLVLIYEKYGISTRLAYNFRSQYIDNLTAGGVQQPPYNLVTPAHLLDLAVSYQLTNNILVSFDATNLNGSNFHDYLGSSIRPRDLRIVDQTFSLGIRAHF